MITLNIFFPILYKFEQFQDYVRLPGQLHLHDQFGSSSQYKEQSPCSLKHESKYQMRQVSQ